MSTKKYLLLIVHCILLISTVAQPKKYSTANAHSHNDYEQAKPFFSAYAQQFGSIEADIFSIPGSASLLVAHEPAQLRTNPRTLDSLYLIPIVNALKSNKGYPYQDTSRHLQLMIDIKTGAVETLETLIKTLQKYPAIIHNNFLHIVISGNRPDPKKFYAYPSYIQFDGNLSETYTPDQLKHIGMISSSFGNYSNWNGNGEFPESDKNRLQSAVQRAHGTGKKVRLWAIPDMPSAWKLMEDLGVDYINTDKIDELTAFLNQ